MLFRSSYEYLLLKRHREIERTNCDTFESDMILDLLREEQEEDNKIKLAITNQINEMDEKVYYSQIYEHVKFSQLLVVILNVLLDELLYSIG